MSTKIVRDLIKLEFQELIVWIVLTGLMLLWQGLASFICRRSLFL